MREYPILFSGPMVRAIIDGRKTQTRRVCKAKKCHDDGDEYRDLDGWPLFDDSQNGTGDIRITSPYGQSGDRLWVRETWRHTASSLEEARAITGDIMSGTAVAYRATAVEELMRDGPMPRADAEECVQAETWKPSIHMPRWACRLELEITDVRVERLQGISGSDAVAEGVRSRLPDNGIAQSEFADLWRSINGADSWDANPWVWAVTFQRVTP